MKIQVFTLAEDSQDGTVCRVFTTKADRDKRLVEIMDQYSGDPEDNNEKAVRSLIDAGDIDKAWEFWTERLREPFDTYGFDDPYLTLPDPPALLAALERIELHCTQDRIASTIGRKKNHTDFLQDSLDRIAKEARAAITGANAEAAAPELLQALQDILNTPTGYLGEFKCGHCEAKNRFASEALSNIPNRGSKKVIIDVKGGCADVRESPPGIEVEIIDHDNLAVGEDR